MGQTIIQVDAFTDRPFSGNPAAVCVIGSPREEEWMQAVAREMNLSETAFLYHEPGTSPGTYQLRWFTPLFEVDLCGHATLASAHALWTEGHLEPNQTARFETKGGLLSATLRDGWITLDFPATPVMAENVADPIAVAEIVGHPVLYAAYSKYDLLVELESEEAVRMLVPAVGKMSVVPVRGVIVTGPASTPGFDFVSRFFAPRVGIDEDPVCGSAHCCLGPFWGERLGKADLVAYQASPRGGVLKVGVRGDRVELSGQAVTTFRGELSAVALERLRIPSEATP